jgi:hypothetical protein
MVSPYLLKPLRSLQEVKEGRNARAEARVSVPSLRTLMAREPGVEFWDARAFAGPRLVWTNTAKPPRRS